MQGHVDQMSKEPRAPSLWPSVLFSHGNCGCHPAHQEEGLVKRSALFASKVISPHLFSLGSAKMNVYLAKVKLDPELFLLG